MGVTLIGSAVAPTTSNLPPTPSPSMSVDMALLSGAVARMTEAPPILVSSSATLTVATSRYRWAPSFRAKASLSWPLPMATVRKPILLANWTPRWPRPPRPCTATRSPATAPLWRRLLKVVMPAQRMGAASAGDKESGINAKASALAIMYCAYPPSSLNPVILRIWQLMKSPRRQGTH